MHCIDCKAYEPAKITKSTAEALRLVGLCCLHPVPVGKKGSEWCLEGVVATGEELAARQGRVDRVTGVSE